MKRTLALTLALGASLALAAPAAVSAQDAAPAAEAAKSFSVATPLAELMANDQTRAVLAKHVPELVEGIEPYLDMIPPDFTLASLADLGAEIPAATMDAIDADLKSL